MKASLATVAFVPIAMLLYSGLGQTDEGKARSEPWQLEETIGQLEQQTSALLESVRQVQQELELQPKTTIVWLKYIKASVAVNSLAESPATKALRGSRDLVIIGANDRLNAVIIHANKTRGCELEEALKVMDVPGK